MALGALFARFWYAIPIALLALATWHLSNRLDTVKGQRDALAAWQSNVREVTSKAAHIELNGKPALLRLDQVPVQIVNMGSAIDKLDHALGEKNAESKRRGEDLIAAREQDRLNRETAARQFAAASRSIDRLRAMAARPNDGKCPADPSLLRELEGL